MSQILGDVIELVSLVVSKRTGNIMGPKQVPMIENRLKSRMIKIGISHLEDYLEYFKKNEAQETEALVSLMTTHHTFFFREFNHFEFLRDTGLRSLVHSLRARGEKKLRIWSAACSKGQEVYSLAMFLNVHLKALAPDFDYEIIGTDIDPESVSFAKAGVYAKEELKSVPKIYLGNHWKVDGAQSDFLKVSPELKGKVRFQVENLFDLESFLRAQEFHMIFCRNVFIYFEKPQIEMIAKKFLEHLNVDGYLFVGVSESITNYGLPLRSLGGSIYEKNSKQAIAPDTNVSVKRNLNTRPYQVLVVDDSKTIHALMKKIFIKDQGFEIAHSVTNGREAIDYLKVNSDKIEMITLDLHMPELDGIGFLKEYQDRSKPILVVSAIDRDDTEGPGQTALRLGAFDYVEKPTVENLEKISNEIRSKLTTGLSLIPTKPPVVLESKKLVSPGLKPVSTKAPSSSSKPSPKLLLKTKPLLARSLNKVPAKAITSKGPLSGVGASKPLLKNNPVTRRSITNTPFQSAVRSLQNARSDSTKAHSTKTANRLSEVVKPPTTPVKALGNRITPRNNQVKVLIVDDSETVRKILKSLLAHDSRFVVVGESENPLEVEGLIRKLKPDLITLDIHMPYMDGVTLLKKYLPANPIPTVMISSISISEGKYVLEALETGAVDYIQKPSLADISKQKLEICERLFVASKAKVKRRTHHPVSSFARPTQISGVISDQGLIVIGSSTGGTEALRVIFERLPEKIPPILVAQHIPAVFSRALADRLNELVKFQIIEAHDGLVVEPNHVYIAPGGKQMGVEWSQDRLKIRVTDDEPVNRHKPSVDYLFSSVAKIQSKVASVVGVILTGMGADGAKGLKLLKDQGAFTIGQNESSCVVYGMPKVAYELGGVQQQLALDQIPQSLVTILSKASKPKAS